MKLSILRSGRGGFTLIEIMIVIAIIAILAGIVVPNMVEAKAEANYWACLENCKTIAQSIATVLVRKSDFDFCEELSNGGYCHFSTWSRGDGRFMSWDSGGVTTYLIDNGYLRGVLRCPTGRGVGSQGGYSVAYNKGRRKQWEVSCNLHTDTRGWSDAPTYIVGVGAVDTLGQPL